MHSKFSSGIELSLVESQKASVMCSCNTVVVSFVIAVLVWWSISSHMESSQQHWMIINGKPQFDQAHYYYNSR